VGIAQVASVKSLGRVGNAWGSSEGGILLLLYTERRVGIRQASAADADGRGVVLEVHEEEEHCHIKGY